MNVVADFIFGTDEDLCAIMVYAIDGILAGVEVYTLTPGSVADRALPSPESLRPPKWNNTRA